MTVGADDEAKKEAEAARARVTAGEDFGKVAAEVSDSRVQGQRRPDRSAAALSDVSEALRKTLRSDEAGGRHPADAHRQGLPDPQARNDEDRRARSRSKRSATWSPTRSTTRGSSPRCASSLARIRSQALIEWKNQDLKKLYEQRIAASATTRPTDAGARCDWYAIWTRSRHEQVGPRAARAERATRRFCRPSRSGAAGRIARRRSTGRSSPATVSRASIRADRLPILKCTGVVEHRLVRRRHRADPRGRDRRRSGGSSRATCSTTRAP